MTRIRITWGGFLVAALLLAGCASAGDSTIPSTPAPVVDNASPTPEPTPETFITPSGYGSLQVGKPAADSDLVVYDAEYCTKKMPEDYFDTNPGRWVLADGSHDLSLHVDEQGIVRIIDVRSAELTTPEGFAVHRTTGASIRTAYKDLKAGDRSDVSTLEYLATPEGNLGFEIGTDPHPIEASESDLLLNLQITSPEIEPRSWAYSDGIAGGCI